MDRNAEPAALIESLAETVRWFEGAARQLPAESLTTAPSPGEWSLNQLLWHIRAQSDVYGEHIARILGEESPSWRHVSPRARMKKARYDRLPFAESFAAFERQRAELLARFSALPPEAWQRVALVRLPGRESRLTLHERVWGMARHKEIHCRQADAAVAALTK
ncbi:MAG: DinB family protein [Hyphomicrobiales bacterium]